MKNFINRNAELDQLYALYRQEKSALVILYGRRRLGKTTLLNAFSEKHDLPCCYFMADRAGEESQKNAVAISMSAALDEPLLQTVSYGTWYDLFAAFDRFRKKDRKIALIFDEYQYLCQMQPAFSSYIQKWWDEHWSDGNILLILCGSVTSMMYRETMAASSPLYGRADAQILLGPLPYNYTRDFFPKRRENELVELYSISGGVPRYLELIREYPSFDEALHKLALHRSGILYREARYLLQEEITTPNTCWSILNALGNGTGRISELGSRLRLPANQLTRYIELLRDLYLIYREVPVLEKNPQKSKKGFYQVADPFLRLWFGAIYPYASFLEFGQIRVVEERLRPLIDSHIAHCYEKLCREFVSFRAVEMDCLRVGRQWGRNYEIDVAGVNGKNELTVVGECKWSRRKVGLSVLRNLKRKITANKLPVSAGCRYLLFGKSGFTEELQDMARRDHRIRLVESIF
ncbi:ATPase [Desulfosarcina widdelii]|uniref:ATPase n=1 Tax=Desulfosarcina widdelii TaxID=947919 RepID=A0A5K7YY13_9BACT|nr:ATP-binding protein [Desulfosarcina widdelii]BBO72803.1 ATPase [Desulfosarcina widdelii]